MSTTARITIPVDEDYRKKLAKKADDLGFDSIQAMFRYIGKALIDGRKVEFGEEDFEPWGPPPEHVVKQWKADIAEMEEDRKAGRLKSFTNVDDFLKDLRSDED